MKNFTELNLNPSLIHSITRMRFKIPTPIQAQAIPHAIIGKDVLGTAQTGTGKTLCYGIACINNLLNNRGNSALIICPTRELAVQIEDVLKGLIDNTMNIKSAALIGGESMQKQLRQLQKRPRLIIGTPGRLNDHLKRKSLKLHQSYFLVLDETDRMLDMGFAPQIEQILKFIPKKHQTLLFSATLPQNILNITERYLNDPIRIKVGSTTTPISKIKQEVIHVSEGEKYNKLLDELAHSRVEFEKILNIKNLYLSAPYGRVNNAIIKIALKAGFCGTLTSRPGFFNIGDYYLNRISLNENTINSFSARFFWSNKVAILFEICKHSFIIFIKLVFGQSIYRKIRNFWLLSKN